MRRRKVKHQAMNPWHRSTSNDNADDHRNRMIRYTASREQRAAGKVLALRAYRPCLTYTSEVHAHTHKHTHSLRYVRTKAVHTSAWNSNASAPSLSCSSKAASMVDGATTASSAVASPIPMEEPPPRQHKRNQRLVWFDLIGLALVWFDLIGLDLVWFDLILTLSHRERRGVGKKSNRKNGTTAPTTSRKQKAGRECVRVKLGVEEGKSLAQGYTKLWIVYCTTCLEFGGCVLRGANTWNM